MAKQKGPTVLVKKKRWVPVIAPKVFNEREIGEIYVGEPKEAIGKNVSVSLMVITGDPQKQSINTGFRITGMTGDKLNTEMLSWSITPSSAKKMMRRNRSKIEESFMVKTADGKKIRIKPIAITRGQASRGVLKALRKELKIRIAKAVEKLKFEQFVKEMVIKKFQRSTADQLRKMHPIAIVEIKKFNIIEEKK